MLNFKEQTKSYSQYQFTLFRIIFGLYLTLHFIFLIPYAADTWSEAGMLSPENNFTYGLFPNILEIITSPIGVTLFVTVLAILSIALMIGYQRPIASLLLWYGWACLFHRNNFINNPGLQYVGWLLLLLVLIPKGEPLSFKDKSKSKWYMPKYTLLGAWLLMGLGYTLSGIHKLKSPSWVDGSAFHHLLTNPLSRDSFLREWFLLLPTEIFTWSILALEISFLFLIINKSTRKWGWIAMVSMHFGILFFVDFMDLTFGMLMIHFFTFDKSWIPAKKEKMTVFYDGPCGLCNAFVQFLMDIDDNKQISYEPLQGSLAKKQVKEYTKEVSTIVMKSKNTIKTKSDAIIHIFSNLGGMWTILSLTRFIPRIIRNKIYDFVAKHRHQFFKKPETCRLR